MYLGGVAILQAGSAAAIPILIAGGVVSMALGLSLANITLHDFLENNPIAVLREEVMENKIGINSKVTEKIESTAKDIIPTGHGNLEKGTNLARYYSGYAEKAEKVATSLQSYHEAREKVLEGGQSYGR
jgi:hypothetical protein